MHIHQYNETYIISKSFFVPLGHPSFSPSDPPPCATHFSSVTTDSFSVSVALF